MAPSPTQEELLASAAEVNRRCLKIAEALDNTQLPPDEATLTALGEVLVNICLANGVRKKQFLQVLKDMWRKAEVARDAKHRAITDGQSQILAGPEEVENAEEALEPEQSITEAIQPEDSEQ